MANHTDHHAEDYTPYNDSMYQGIDYNDIRFEEGLRELEKQIDIILSRTSKTERNVRKDHQTVE